MRIMKFYIDYALTRFRIAYFTRFIFIALA